MLKKEEEEAENRHRHILSVYKIVRCFMLFIIDFCVSQFFYGACLNFAQAELIVHANHVHDVKTYERKNSGNFAVFCTSWTIMRCLACVLSCENSLLLNT